MQNFPTPWELFLKCRTNTITHALIHSPTFPVQKAKQRNLLNLCAMNAGGRPTQIKDINLRFFFLPVDSPAFPTQTTLRKNKRPKKLSAASALNESSFLLFPRGKSLHKQKRPRERGRGSEASHRQTGDVFVRSFSFATLIVLPCS